MRHGSETWVMTAEALSGLWHANCHGPLDLLHHHEEQRLLRPTSRRAWQSGCGCGALHCLDLGGLWTYSASRSGWEEEIQQAK